MNFTQEFAYTTGYSFDNTSEYDFTTDFGYNDTEQGM